MSYLGCDERRARTSAYSVVSRRIAISGRSRAKAENSRYCGRILSINKQRFNNPANRLIVNYETTRSVVVVAFS